jgi:hypothetical protein
MEIKIFEISIFSSFLTIREYIEIGNVIGRFIVCIEQG